MLYLALGDPEKALQYFRTAAETSREMGHVRDEGHSLVGVGMSLELAGDAPGAADAYGQSIELLETAHEVSGMPEELAAKAEAMTLLGNVLGRSLGGPEESLKAYEAAAACYRELDDAWHLRRVSLVIAGLRWRVGDAEGSAQAYEDILDSAGEEPAHGAAALASLSVVYRDLGRPKDSLAYGREALRSLRDLDDPRAESYVLANLAESHARLGQHPSARSCLRQSLRLRQEIGDEEGEIDLLRSLAKVYIDLGDLGLARSSLEEAGRKTEALAERTSPTATKTAPAAVVATPKGPSETKAEAAHTGAAKTEDRVSKLRWLRSYITDSRGRKFYYEYEAPSMETVLKDSRRAGLAHAPPAVTPLLESDMFR
jgi:tetratricopeptide (TPR) repeat protein